jgi:signal transduction histidine kinase/CheY-like chemotaxis protein
MAFVPWLIAGAFVVLLALAAGIEARRRAALRRLATLERVADHLRDDVWRLEAAAGARDRAEAASEAKSRFLATVSHEVRTPLNGILGLADLLGSLPLDREAASYVEGIRASGLALGGLIDEILDFSRIESGRLELEDVAFDLHPLVEGVVELLAPRAQGKGVEIASLVVPGTPARLRGDPARLRQILINLAGNAIKFTDKGGVGLRVARDDAGLIRFAIEDTGCGIPADRQAAIFDEFEQGDSTRSRGGAGLGLAISQRLAQGMGGALALVRSSPAGSLFDLALPLAVEATAPPERQPNPLTILVVACSPFEAPFLAERLAAAGARVLRADGEAEALTHLRGPLAFQAAIIDCALGEEAATRIAGAAHQAGVARALVMLSPFERRSLAPSAWRAFDGWLVKPVRDASLHHCLAESSEAAASPAPGGATAAPRLDGIRVLVAEDNDINALIVTRQLERHGAAVTRVTDGQRALDAIEQARAAGPPFDAALLDIRMPVVDGLETMRRLRRAEDNGRLPHLPVAAISADVFAGDQQAAISVGFDLFLVKPVDPPRLIAAIARITGRDAPRRDATMPSPAAVITP